MGTISFEIGAYDSFDAETKMPIHNTNSTTTKCAYWDELDK